MALNTNPKVIKKGEPRSREERPRRQLLYDEKARLMKRVRQIDRELQTT
jgi:hypothetical protein